ncbi:MAG: Flp pilus assembly protein CpaB [Burkholderiales bacterium]|nr:Flp pilus assembly protein CpaB [Burkholderiales bacterium]
MKSTRGMFMLLVALLAGGAAVLFASKWMNAQAKNSGQIAVAAVDVETGARLVPEMLRMVTWPAGNEPPGAYADLAALNGRVVKTSLTRGEPILEGKLAPAGTKGGLSAVVAEGRRAITVRVNDVIGVAGFALPGNYVDIMVNTQSDAGKRGDQDKSISKIVLERILVLAIAQEASRDETKPKVVNAVTLEVTPEQAENLDLARSVGTLSLVLRNQVDPKPGSTEGATKTSMLREMHVPQAASAPKAVTPRRSAPRVVVAAVAAPAPEAPKSTNCVEVIRGTVKSNECF